MHNMAYTSMYIHGLLCKYYVSNSSGSTEPIWSSSITPSPFHKICHLKSDDQNSPPKKNNFWNSKSWFENWGSFKKTEKCGMLSKMIRIIEQWVKFANRPLKLCELRLLKWCEIKVCRSSISHASKFSLGNTHLNCNCLLSCMEDLGSYVQQSLPV